MSKKNPNLYTFVECRTYNGNLVTVECHPDDVDAVKESFKLIRNVKNAVNKEHVVEHGGYCVYTRFDIIQHKYAGGGNGYIEALEIKNPPDGRAKFIYYSFRENFFREYENLDDLIYAFKSKFNNTTDKDNHIRHVSCGMLSPWFYASGDECISNDVVVPNFNLFHHPVFKQGEKFVILEGGSPRVKTVICCHKTKKRSGYKNGDADVIFICWSDGSYTELTADINRHVRPLREEIWISEAYDKFVELCSGDRKSFRIDFKDGAYFTGRLCVRKEYDPPGRYEVTYVYKKPKDKKRKTSTGRIYFKPSKKYPTVESEVRRQADGAKVKLFKISNKKKLRDEGWHGLFDRK